MAQSITIKIAGCEYPMKVTSPEMEQAMRIAAETINKRLTAFDVKYPNKTLSDKLIFIALNETMNKIHSQRDLAKVGNEAAALQKDLEAYLKTIENSSR